jgi:hypothetical protein
MRIARALVLTLLLPWLAACATAPRPSTGGVEELAAWMTGSFDSSAQAQADPENYRDIRLHMTRIWLERKDGAWLYVEQAVAATQDKPYRQRVYHVVGLPDGSFRSEVFTIDGDPLRFAGGFRDAAKLGALSERNLVPRAGCAISLRRTADSYEGSTTGKECPSELRGASYATSIVTVLHYTLRSWDRGFDQHDAQVWGATKGPYVFVKAR